MAEGNGKVLNEHILKSLDNLERKVDSGFSELHRLCPAHGTRITLLENEQLPTRMRRLEKWYISITAIGAFLIGLTTLGWAAIQIVNFMLKIR